MRPIFMKFGTQNKSNMLILNIILGTDDLDPKLWIWVDLVPTLKFAPIFKKYGTHNKSNILIMNKHSPVSRVLAWLLTQNDHKL